MLASPLSCLGVVGGRVDVGWVWGMGGVVGGCWVIFVRCQVPYVARSGFSLFFLRTVWRNSPSVFVWWWLGNGTAEVEGLFGQFCYL